MIINVSSENLKKVSNENLKRVKDYFERESKGGEIIVIAIASKIAAESGVALATSHKAVMLLEKDKIIKVIRGKSRREASQYIYFPQNKPHRTKEQLEIYVEQLEQEVEELKKKLSKYVKDFREVQLVTFDDGLKLKIMRE